MPATSVPSSSRAAAVDAVAAARVLGSDPIATIRRTPHPPMRGDDRLDRRLARRVSGLRPARSAR